jgi:hypothetical protein
MNMIVSVNDDQAQKFAAGVAATIEYNLRWKIVFPDVVPDRDKGWSREGYYVKRAGLDYADWVRLTADRVHPTLTAGGVGSSLIIGKRVTGLLVCDDLHDDKSKSSAATREQTITFFKTTLSSRPTEAAHMVVIGNRWHPADVFKHIVDTGLYTVFTHPALPTELYEALISFSHDHQTFTDEALTVWETETLAAHAPLNTYWPALWSLSRLLRKFRELGDVDFQLMCQCDATAAEGHVLKAEALHWFEAKNIVRTWIHYGGVDFAQKLQELTARQEARHSRFAYAMLAFSGTLLVLVDGLVDLIAMGEAENGFFTLSEVYRPVRVGIEVNAQNRAYYNNLLRRKVEQGYHWLNLMPINTTRNIGLRMSEMEPDFRHSAIQVSDSANHFLREFYAEWLAFGQKHARDDTLSAVHLARQSAYNLLPKEDAEAQRRRDAHKPVSIARQIEQAYR